MTAKNPSTTWYFNDWENDPELKVCSLAAQGLWMRLLCIAARSPEHGVVQIGDLILSYPDGLPRIAAAIGRPLEEIVPLIGELVASGAASLDRRKRIISRRLKRAAGTAAERSAAGKEGATRRWGSPKGEPRLRHQRLAEARTKGKHTKEEWLALVEVFEHRCVRCNIPAADLSGGSLCKDHVAAIYAGGSDDVENLQPMCRNCNSKKGAGTFDFRDKAVPDWRERLAKRLPNRMLSSKPPPPDPLLINSGSTLAARASASPDGPPRPRLPDSAIWAERLDQFRPWLPHDQRGRWDASWGLRPDSAGSNPFVPPLQLAAWRLLYTAKMREAMAA